MTNTKKGTWILNLQQIPKCCAFQVLSGFPLEKIVSEIHPQWEGPTDSFLIHNPHLKKDVGEYAYYTEGPYEVSLAIPEEYSYHGVYWVICPTQQQFSVWKDWIKAEGFQPVTPWIKNRGGGDAWVCMFVKPRYDDVETKEFKWD